VGDTREPVGEEGLEGATTPRLSRATAAIRGVAIDITPLRRSRDYRVLWLGQLVGLTGRQISAVALPYQVFILTRSSLAVGLIGLAQVLPLIVVSIAAGPLVDRMDRRKLILGSELGLALTSGLLLAGALAGRPSVWYLYILAGAQAGLSGISGPARSAAIPNLVSRAQLPAAMALSQVLFNTSMIVGPGLAGVVLARFGLSWAYGAELASFVGSISAAALLRPLPPKRSEDADQAMGWRAIKEGFAYLRTRRALVGTFLIDLNAMIFGMPRALFPVLALTVFEVGPEGLGLLYAAPSVGALAGALTAGWVGRVRAQGRAVIWAVVVWGGAIAAFGFSGRLFWLALAFLALAGAADVVSAVFRGTILQASVPDDLRGRLSSINIMVVAGGPRVGDLEAGVAAALVSPWFSVVSGGLACVVGALVVAVLMPELARYKSDDHGEPVTLAGDQPS
jgi:MFS family permease